MSKRRASGLVVLAGGALLALAVGARAEEWGQWRGPFFNGSTTETGLPENLDPKSSGVWATEMPGRSDGTPAVWGDRMFVTSMSGEHGLLAMCVDRKSGKVLWTNPVGDTAGINRSYFGFGKNDLATPSPVTDGKVVVFLYATGDFVAFDTNGKQLWSRNLQREFGRWNVQWIYGSSPLLYKGKLYVQVLHRDVPIMRPAAGPKGKGKRGPGGPGGPGGGALVGTPAPAGVTDPGPHADSYLLAVDPATGKDLWRHIRPNDAVQETKESYATPMPLEGKDGKTKIVLIGGDCVTAHDAGTGEEIWRCGGWNPEKIESWRLVPSVLVVENELVIACPPKGGKMFAIRDGGHGDVTNTHKAWVSDVLTSDVCVPLYYQGKMFVLDGDKKTLSRVEAKTGKKEWSVSLGGRPVFRASPTGADGKIYCMNEDAEVWVVSAADGKQFYKGTLAGEDDTVKSRASIVASHGQVYVRTAGKLYAFEKK